MKKTKNTWRAKRKQIILLVLTDEKESIRQEATRQEKSINQYLLSLHKMAVDKSH